MSAVTNLIFVASCMSDEDVKPFADKYSFVKVDDYAGGPKAMEADVYLAAHNYLDEQPLLEDFNQLPDCEYYQILIKRQEEDFFKELARKEPQ